MSPPAGTEVSPVPVPIPAPAAAANLANGARQWTVPPELIPNLDALVIEDGAAVDGVFSERQMRLLTRPLFASWPGPGARRPFAVLANVGLFNVSDEPPLVPDVMLSLDVAWPSNLHVRENLSYFVWLRHRGPEAVIEIVSNREGGEGDRKMRDYERFHIPYHVVFDPDNLLGSGRVRVHVLHGTTYQLLPEPWWFPDVGLGLTEWEGAWEGSQNTWLRGCDRQGQVIPSGEERAVQADQRADQAERAADQAKQGANEAKRHAEQAEEALERLRAHLRSLGLEPPT